MNFDKLVDSSLKVVPKRLSFDFLNMSNTSDNEKASKKRRFSELENNKQQMNLSQSSTFLNPNETERNETLNSSTGSLCGSWEAKLLKGDLVEAQSRITQLKKEIQHQETIQAEMELKFTAKEKALENEKNQLQCKADELLKILKRNRKNESHLKEEVCGLKNQLCLNKQNFDRKLFSIQTENSSLKENLSFDVNDLNNEISQLKRQNTELSSKLVSSEEECKALSIQNERLKTQVEDLNTMRNDYEKEKNDHFNIQMKVKELEYEISGYGNWKSLSKALQSQAQNVSEMEKELKYLRHTNNNLQESLGNKLLLEEQVHDLATRLKRYDDESNHQTTMKIEVETLEKELKEWKKLASDFSEQNSSINPINLRSYIENHLHRNLLLMSEKSNQSSEKSSLQTELEDIKNKNQTLTTQIESLRKSLKSHQSVLAKLQKKLLLVTTERDSQRQLLDSYERDLTISQTSTSNSASAESQQNRIRNEMLEKTVNGYKELCAKLEAELAEVRRQTGGQLVKVSTTSSSDQYDALRNDLDSFRSENEKLKKRKNELEIEIENMLLRQNVMGNDNRFKVVHFKQNPSSIAQEENVNDVAKLKAEIERLKIRNKKLEAGNEDLTTRVNETMSMTLNIKEFQNLREEYKTLEAKYKENEKVFTNVNQELREVIYMLFGYKLDRYGHSNYRITSMYADHENDELMFQLNSQGTLDMLETEYSKTLDTLVDNYLRSATGSLPAFTSALTLDLVLKMTMTST